MTLTELNQMSDEEFAYKAAELLDIRKRHYFVYKTRGDKCAFCGTRFEGDKCCPVPITLDWNTAMPLLEEAFNESFEIQIANDAVGNDKIGWLYLFSPREVITAVLLARGLVEGE